MKSITVFRAAMSKKHKTAFKRDF